MSERKSIFNKVFIQQKITDDLFIELYKTDDFTDEELQTVFLNAIEYQDFEYCEALKTEATARGFKLKSK